MHNIIKKLKQVKVDPRYDISANDLNAIIEYSENNFYKALINCFSAGYMQGQKAEKAHQRNK